MSDDWLPEPPSREWVKRTGEWIDKTQKLNEATAQQRIRKFAEESNMIEGITDVVQHEIMAAKLSAFLTLEKLTIDNVCDFNQWGKLRDKGGMNARVGIHQMPNGGKYIKSDLVEILELADLADSVPFDTHQEFERLHPFTDGNGRTGRAIWLWQMVNQQGYDLRRGFLHEWYYQSLGD